MTTVCAYLFIVGYFVVERSLRKGKPALSLKPGEQDAGSSRVLWISGTLNLSLIFAAPVLNAYQIGVGLPAVIGWIGVGLMAVGLAIRYWAAKALGEFYTRTLQTFESQEIVDCPPYSVIRHPGYLGVSLLQVGAGLAVQNWIVFVAVLLLGSAARVYRIRIEERMLAAQFGVVYADYSARTWRVIPFVY